jgi:hypothetical protein
MKTIQMLLLSSVGASILSCAMVERDLPRTMSDANIVSVINTIDQGELDTAYLALFKASAPVRQYAAHLVHEHTAKLDKNRTLVHSMNLVPDTAKTVLGFAGYHSSPGRYLAHKIWFGF